MPKNSEEGIACPKCKGRLTKIKETRPTSRVVKRSRDCRSCGHRFVTFEMSQHVLGEILLDKLGGVFLDMIREDKETKA